MTGRSGCPSASYGRARAHSRQQRIRGTVIISTIGDSFDNVVVRIEFLLRRLSPLLPFFFFLWPRSSDILPGPLAAEQ